MTFPTRLFVRPARLGAAGSNPHFIVVVLGLVLGEAACAASSRTCPEHPARASGECVQAHARDYWAPTTPYPPVDPEARNMAPEGTPAPRPAAIPAGTKPARTQSPHGRR